MVIVAVDDSILYSNWIVELPWSISLCAKRCQKVSLFSVDNDFVTQESLT